MAVVPSSSHGSTGAAAGFVQLATQTLASPGTLDIQSIDQTYSDLVVVAIIRGTAAAASDNPKIRFNNDSSAHYGDQNLSVSTTTVSGAELATSATAFLLATVPAASAAAGLFGKLVIWIPGYASTTWQKDFFLDKMSATDITSGSMPLHATVGLWNQTTAINRITLFGTTAANLATGSVMRIYGQL